MIHCSRKLTRRSDCSSPFLQKAEPFSKVAAEFPSLQQIYRKTEEQHSEVPQPEPQAWPKESEAKSEEEEEEWTFADKE